jgi:predicted exporter
LPPHFGIWMSLVLAVTIVLAALVTLVLVGLGGMVPVLPFAVIGLYVVGKWWNDRTIVKDERRKSGDLDQELRKLIEGNYL